MKSLENSDPIVFHEDDCQSHGYLREQICYPNESVYSQTQENMPLRRQVTILSQDVNWEEGLQTQFSAQTQGQGKEIFESPLPALVDQSQNKRSTLNAESIQSDDNRWYSQQSSSQFVYADVPHEDNKKQVTQMTDHSDEQFKFQSKIHFQNTTDEIVNDKKSHQQINASSIDQNANHIHENDNLQDILANNYIKVKQIPKFQDSCEINTLSCEEIQGFRTNESCSLASEITVQSQILANKIRNSQLNEYRIKQIADTEIIPSYEAEINNVKNNEIQNQLNNSTHHTRDTVMTASFQKHPIDINDLESLNQSQLPMIFIEDRSPIYIDSGTSSQIKQSDHIPLNQHINISELNITPLVKDKIQCISSGIVQELDIPQIIKEVSEKHHPEIEIKKIILSSISHVGSLSITDAINSLKTNSQDQTSPLSFKEQEGRVHIQQQRYRVQSVTSEIDHKHEIQMDLRPYVTQTQRDKIQAPLTQENIVSLGIHQIENVPTSSFQQETEKDTIKNVVNVKSSFKEEQSTSPYFESSRILQNAINIASGLAETQNQRAQYISNLTSEYIETSNKWTYEFKEAEKLRQISIDQQMKYHEIQRDQENDLQSMPDTLSLLQQQNQVSSHYVNSKARNEQTSIGTQVNNSSEQERIDKLNLAYSLPIAYDINQYENQRKLSNKKKLQTLSKDANSCPKRVITIDLSEPISYVIHYEQNVPVIRQGILDHDCDIFKKENQYQEEQQTLNFRAPSNQQYGARTVADFIKVQDQAQEQIQENQKEIRDDRNQNIDRKKQSFMINYENLQESKLESIEDEFILEKKNTRATKKASLIRNKHQQKASRTRVQNSIQVNENLDESQKQTKNQTFNYRSTIDESTQSIQVSKSIDSQFRDQKRQIYSIQTSLQEILISPIKNKIAVVDSKEAQIQNEKREELQLTSINFDQFESKKITLDQQEHSRQNQIKTKNEKSELELQINTMSLSISDEMTHQNQVTFADISCGNSNEKQMPHLRHQFAIQISPTKYQSQIKNSIERQDLSVDFNFSQIEINDEKKQQKEVNYPEKEISNSSTQQNFSLFNIDSVSAPSEHKAQVNPEPLIAELNENFSILPLIKMKMPQSQDAFQKEFLVSQNLNFENISQPKDEAQISVIFSPQQKQIITSQKPLQDIQQPLQDFKIQDKKVLTFQALSFNQEVSPIEKKLLKLALGTVRSLEIKPQQKQQNSIDANVLQLNKICSSLPKSIIGKHIEEYSDKLEPSYKLDNVRKSFSVFSNGFIVQKYQRGASQNNKNSEKSYQSSETDKKDETQVKRSISVSNFNDYLSTRGRNKSTKEVRFNSNIQENFQPFQEQNENQQKSQRQTRWQPVKNLRLSIPNKQINSTSCDDNKSQENSKIVNEVDEANLKQYQSNYDNDQSKVEHAEQPVAYDVLKQPRLKKQTVIQEEMNLDENNLVEEVIFEEKINKKKERNVTSVSQIYRVRNKAKKAPQGKNIIESIVTPPIYETIFMQKEKQIEKEESRIIQAKKKPHQKQNLISSTQKVKTQNKQDFLLPKFDSQKYLTAQKEEKIKSASKSLNKTNLIYLLYSLNKTNQLQQQITLNSGIHFINSGRKENSKVTYKNQQEKQETQQPPQQTEEEVQVKQTKNFYNNASVMQTQSNFQTVQHQDQTIFQSNCMNIEIIQNIIPNQGKTQDKEIFEEHQDHYQSPGNCSEQDIKETQAISLNQEQVKIYKIQEEIMTLPRQTQVFQMVQYTPKTLNQVSSIKSPIKDAPVKVDDQQITQNSIISMSELQMCQPVAFETNETDYKLSTKKQAQQASQEKTNIQKINDKIPEFQIGFEEDRKNTEKKFNEDAISEILEKLSAQQEIQIQSYKPIPAFKICYKLDQTSNGIFNKINEIQNYSKEPTKVIQNNETQQNKIMNKKQSQSQIIMELPNIQALSEQSKLSKETQETHIKSDFPIFQQVSYESSQMTNESVIIADKLIMHKEISNLQTHKRKISGSTEIIPNCEAKDLESLKQESIREQAQNLPEMVNELTEVTKNQINQEEAQEVKIESPIKTQEIIQLPFWQMQNTSCVVQLQYQQSYLEVQVQLPTPRKEIFQIELRTKEYQETKIILDEPQQDLWSFFQKQTILKNNFDQKPEIFQMVLNLQEELLSLPSTNDQALWLIHKHKELQTEGEEDVDFTDKIEPIIEIESKCKNQQQPDQDRQIPSAIELFSMVCQETTQKTLTYNCEQSPLFEHENSPINYNSDEESPTQKYNQQDLSIVDRFDNGSNGPRQAINDLDTVNEDQEESNEDTQSPQSHNQRCVQSSLEPIESKSIKQTFERFTESQQIDENSKQIQKKQNVSILPQKDDDLQTKGEKLLILQQQDPVQQFQFTLLDNTKLEIMPIESSQRAIKPREIRHENQVVSIGIVNDKIKQEELETSHQDQLQDTHIIQDMRGFDSTSNQWNTQFLELNKVYTNEYLLTQNQSSVSITNNKTQPFVTQKGNHLIYDKSHKEPSIQNTEKTNANKILTKDCKSSDMMKTSKNAWEFESNKQYERDYKANSEIKNKTTQNLPIDSLTITEMIFEENRNDLSNYSMTGNVQSQQIIKKVYHHNMSPQDQNQGSEMQKTRILFPSNLDQNQRIRFYSGQIDHEVEQNPIQEEDYVEFIKDKKKKPAARSGHSQFQQKQRTISRQKGNVQEESKQEMRNQQPSKLYIGETNVLDQKPTTTTSIIYQLIGNTQRDQNPSPNIIEKLLSNEIRHKDLKQIDTQGDKISYRLQNHESTQDQASPLEVQNTFQLQIFANQTNQAQTSSYFDQIKQTQMNETQQSNQLQQNQLKQILTVSQNSQSAMQASVQSHYRGETFFKDTTNHESRNKSQNEGVVINQAKTDINQECQVDTYKSSQLHHQVLFADPNMKDAPKKIQKSPTGKDQNLDRLEYLRKLVHNDINQLFQNPNQGNPVYSAENALELKFTPDYTQKNSSLKEDMVSRRIDTSSNNIDNSIDFNQFKDSDNSSYIQLHSLNCYRVQGERTSSEEDQELSQSHNMSGLTSLPPIAETNSSYLLDGSMLDCFNEINIQMNQNQNNKNKHSIIDANASSLINPLSSNNHIAISPANNQQLLLKSNGTVQDSESLDRSYYRKIRQYSVETAGFMEEYTSSQYSRPAFTPNQQESASGEYCVRQDTDQMTQSEPRSYTNPCGANPRECKSINTPIIYSNKHVHMYQSGHPSTKFNPLSKSQSNLSASPMSQSASALDSQQQFHISRLLQEGQNTHQLDHDLQCRNSQSQMNFNLRQNLSKRELQQIQITTSLPRFTPQILKSPALLQNQQLEYQYEHLQTPTSAMINPIKNPMSRSSTIIDKFQPQQQIQQEFMLDSNGLLGDITISLDDDFEIEDQLQNKNFKESQSIEQKSLKKYKMFLKNSKMASKAKRQFFIDKNPSISRLLPLLQGALFYKKFTSRQSLKPNAPAFDPLEADQLPPEKCGYGIRFVQLDQSLQYINIRQNLKNQTEYQIPVVDITKPILPQITMEIIKTQKQNGNKRILRQNADMLEEQQMLDKQLSSLSHLAKIGMVNKNSDLYRSKCIESTFYPFSIALSASSNFSRDIESKRSTPSLNISSNSLNQSKTSSAKQGSGRVELIATSYSILKEWVLGINLLIDNKQL